MDRERGLCTVKENYAIEEGTLERHTDSTNNRYTGSEEATYKGDDYAHKGAIHDGT